MFITVCVGFYKHVATGGVGVLISLVKASKIKYKLPQNDLYCLRLQG